MKGDKHYILEAFNADGKMIDRRSFMIPLNPLVPDPEGQRKLVLEREKNAMLLKNQVRLRVWEGDVIQWEGAPNMGVDDVKMG